jgi:hypothetical protein
MRHFIVLVGWLGASVLVSQGAYAATTKPFHIASWSGGAISNDQTRQFERCSANLTNAGGVTIIYSLSAQYSWSLAFSSPAWGFSKGDSFNVVLRTADRDDVRQRAIAVTNQLVELQLDDSIALFDRLRRRGQLQVVAGGLNFGFELNANSEVLAALMQCVAQQRPVPRNAKPITPFSSPPVPAQPAANPDPARRSEAAELAADIITYAGIHGASVLAPNESPGVRADAVWKVATAVTGVVSILAPDSGTKLDDMPARLIAGDSQACHGEFFSAAVPEVIEDTRVMRIFTACYTAPTTTTIYYVAVKRNEGGLYLLAIKSSGIERLEAAPQPAKEVDGAVRGVIIKVLSK